MGPIACGRRDWRDTSCMKFDALHDFVNSSDPGPNRIVAEGVRKSHVNARVLRVDWDGHTIGMYDDSSNHSTVQGKHGIDSTPKQSDSSIPRQVGYSVKWGHRVVGDHTFSLAALQAFEFFCRHINSAKRDLPIRKHSER